ncbi:MAG: bifunctional 2-polyprenyl-6-hydroxyphenol methylase/3-demethylubiquinol 3-O-methyltransferase UbiG [Gammaproteobacteria bacterium]|nr:bifunctional 2-polyprenyl-6-hydroxyphenol methylase/3-demethylubiquinol 3-O-methyltransferase UbiG [Gammaproteobacteria bacterium]
MQTQSNVYQEEIQKFGARAQRWWDTEGEFKTLHQINPLRLQFIAQHMDISGKKIADIGCGGGILSESLAHGGAEVSAIDLSPELIDVADLHSLETGVKVDYQVISAEQFAEQQSEQFDAVTCMEMLEHVPDPQSIIIACSKLVKPGGQLFFSTLNRNRKAWLLAIVGAEYMLHMLPKGTHEYSKFIRPSELAGMARNAGLSLTDMGGIEYNPVSKQFYLSTNVDVNYLAAFNKNP